MSFFEINGWTIPLAYGKPSVNLEGNRRPWRSFTNRPIVGRNNLFYQWTGETIQLNYQDAFAVWSLVEGRGHVVPFDNHIHGVQSGVAPDTASGFVAFADGRFGKSAVLAGTPARIAYDTKLYDEDWTAWVWRSNDTGATWNQVGIRNDGGVITQFVNGVPSSWMTGSPDTIEVGSGSVFIFKDGAYDRVDDLVVLPFPASDAAMLAWYSWMDSNDSPFSPLPRLIVSGDFMKDREFTVLGGEGSAEFLVATDKADNTRKNNMAKVSFTLDEIAPAVFKGVPDPLSHWRLDDSFTDNTAYDSFGSINGSAPTNVTSSTSPAKINKAALFTLAHSGINLGNNFNFDFDQDFTWSMWFNMTTLSGNGRYLVMKHGGIGLGQPYP